MVGPFSSDSYPVGNSSSSTPEPNSEGGSDDDFDPTRLVDAAFGVADVHTGLVEKSAAVVGGTIEGMAFGDVSPDVGLDLVMGVSTLNDGINGFMTAIDGKEREPTLQNWGGEILGSTGAQTGLIISNLSTMQGWRRLLQGPINGQESVELMEAYKQMYDSVNEK